MPRAVAPRWPALALLLLAAAALPLRAEEPEAAQVTVQLQLEGVTAEDERANVLAWLGYAQAAEDGTLTEARARALFETIPKSAAQALEPYGYYNAKVVSSLEGAAPAFIARVVIEPGAPVRWVAPELLVEGAGSDAAFLQPLLADRRLQAGRRLRHADYEGFKTGLVSAARDDGYLDASLSRSVLSVDPAKGSAQAQFTLVTGSRFFFGPTRFTGPIALREDLLRRYLRYDEGAPFAPQKLLDSQFALSDSDYFEEVQLSPQRDEVVDGRVPVLVSLTPRKNRRDSLGLGYGTDTGFRGSIGSEVRRLNRQGHKLNAELRLSEKLTGVSTIWRIPQGENPGEYLSFSGEIRQEQFSADVGTEDYKLGVSLNRTLGSWKRRYYLEFTRSITDVGFSQAAANAGQRLAGETSVLVPGLSLSTTRTDDSINVNRGWSLFTDVHGAQEGLLSSTSFLQGRVLLRGVLSLPRRFRLSSRLEVGATVVKGFAELPLEQRFFAGGDDSVRGYNYRDLGVRDAGGNNLGGRFVNTASIELERAIRGPYGAALFWDAGGVADTPTPTLHHGAGVGFRYRAPFGSVRVDLAHPFDDGEPPVVLHLGVRVGL